MSGRRTLACLGMALSLLGAPVSGQESSPSEIDRDEIVRIVEEVLEARKQQEESTATRDPLESFKLFGDFRFRHESSFHRDGQRDRHRQRIRLRLGANYLLSDDTLLGARLVTGDPDEPTSTHVTLGSGFDDLDISLDRAFLNHRFSWLGDDFVSLGKFDHPFFENPVYGELVWDADLQPEGIAVGASHLDLSPTVSLEAVAGVYPLAEFDEADDVFLLVGQVAERFDFGEIARGTLAVGYYYYSDPTPGSETAVVDTNGGNATVDTNGDGVPDEFVSEFGILNPIGVVETTVNGTPVKLAGEFIWNTRAEISEDKGWVVGASVGSIREPGGYRVDYQWQLVQQDAVFSPLAQDDFLLRTNHRTHLFSVSYKITEAIDLQVWGMVSARERRSPGPTTDSDRDQWRLRADLNVRF